MTLDELLAACNTIVDDDASTRPHHRRIAQAVIDMLGESLPCGVETPEVMLDGIWANVSAATPNEARAIAAAILRAADVADGGAR